MSRLLLFTPCEKVITAKEDNTLSLITILQDVVMRIPSDAQVPEGAQLHLNWSVISLWLNQDEDQGKEHFVDFELRAPSGNIRAVASSSVTVNSARHRVVMTFTNFPAGEVGIFDLKLFLREGEGERKQVASYPLNVSRKDP